MFAAGTNMKMEWDNLRQCGTTCGWILSNVMVIGKLTKEKPHFLPQNKCNLLVMETSIHVSTWWAKPALQF